MCKPEVIVAVSKFIEYIKLGWEVEQSFEIAYDSVYDVIEKEAFLDQCQKACLEMNVSFKN